MRHRAILQAAAFDAGLQFRAGEQTRPRGARHPAHQLPPALGLGDPTLLARHARRRKTSESRCMVRPFAVFDADDFNVSPLQTYKVNASHKAKAENELNLKLNDYIFATYVNGPKDQVMRGRLAAFLLLLLPPLLLLFGCPHQFTCSCKSCVLFVRASQK